MFFTHFYKYVSFKPIQYKDQSSELYETLIQRRLHNNPP